MLATVLEANASKNIFCLEITVGKEMKSTSTKKTFLRVIAFNNNINSICDFFLYSNIKIYNEFYV